jgi:hypothetical protein
MSKQQAARAGVFRKEEPSAVKRKTGRVGPCERRARQKAAACGVWGDERPLGAGYGGLMEGRERKWIRSSINNADGAER